MRATSEPRKRRWESAEGQCQEAWVFNYKDPKTGKRPQVTRATKKEADAARLEIETELKAGTHIGERDDITFAKLVKHYFERCDQRVGGRNPDLSPDTLYQYKGKIRYYILPRFGPMKLKEIKVVHVQDFINALSTKYAGGTCNYLYSRIWELFEFAVDTERLPRNPLRDRSIDLPKQAKREKIPEYEDVHKILEYLLGARPSQWKTLDWEQKLPLVGLAAFAGLRDGECRGLSCEDIDLDGRNIHVRQTRGRLAGMKDPKSAAGIRKVPITPILHHILVEYRDFLENRLLGGEWAGQVFMTHTGAWPHHTWTGSQFRALMAGVGLIDDNGGLKFTFHALRHFAGSMWLAQGVRIQDVSWMLGHADIKTTMRIYAHQLKGDEHARTAMDSVAGLFPGLPHIAPQEPLDLQALPAPVKNPG